MEKYDWRWQLYSLVKSNELKVNQFKHNGDIHCFFKGKLVENELNFTHYKMKHELKLCFFLQGKHPQKTTSLFSLRGLCWFDLHSFSSCIYN